MSEQQYSVKITNLELSFSFLFLAQPLMSNVPNVSMFLCFYVLNHIFCITGSILLTTVGTLVTLSIATADKWNR